MKPMFSQCRALASKILFDSNLLISYFQNTVSKLKSNFASFLSPSIIFLIALVKALFAEGLEHTSQGQRILLTKPSN